LLQSVRDFPDLNDNYKLTKIILKKSIGPDPSSPLLQAIFSAGSLIFFGYGVYLATEYFWVY